MFTPPLPARNPLSVKQPIPTSRPSYGGYSPNVEWLEQSAERMSLHSSSTPGSCGRPNSQTRRRSDSRRSSLRSRSQFCSSPTHPYEVGSPWDVPISEDDEPSAVEVPPELLYASELDRHDVGATSAAAHDKHQCYAHPFPVAPRNRYPSQPQIYRSDDPFERPTEDQRGLAVHQAPSSVSRGPSTATTSTMKHAGSLFRDFDGTHRAPTESGDGDGSMIDHCARPLPEFAQLQPVNETDDEMIRDLQRAYDEAAKDTEIDQQIPSETGEQRVDILPSQPHNLKPVEPPPAENMVYYPAPIPMQLNRPQRLSQLPPPSASGQRRSQVFGRLQVQARNSAVWQPGVASADEPAEPNGEPSGTSQGQSKQRQSVLNLQKLPPQLRASIFFDQQSIPHKVEIKQGSAVATLDSLLDASAQAPVHASVDDTMRIAAANLANQQNKLGASSSPQSPKDEDAQRSRLSLLPFRKASADRLSQLRQRESSALSHDAHTDEPVGEDDFGGEDEMEDDYGNNNDNEAGLLANHSSAGSYSREEADDDDHEELHDDEQLESRDENTVQTPDFPEAPTTLLAELQLRKQELRSRTRTAANAFPNGMHSTLLELDAVAQIEKKNRKGARTTLAWEEPDLVAAAKEKLQDENVPLAMLYPSKNGLASKTGGSDWDRPLGLLAKRDLEESEPLSKRRNRLKKNNPNAGNRRDLKNGGTGEDDSDHEGETLAQRTRRLKSTKALNEAIRDGTGRQVSEGFANDVMSQFGGLNDNKAKEQESSAEPAQDLAPDEETLGQRKKRLEAEGKATRVDSEGGGLATQLVSNPMGNIRQVLNESASSGVVGQSGQPRLQHPQQHIYQQNQVRSVSLVDPRLVNSQQAPEQAGQFFGLLGANGHTLPSRQQELQAIGEPFVGQQRPSVQHNIMQCNQYGAGPYTQTGQPMPMFNDKIDVMKRQTKAFIDSRYNSGPSGLATARATSAFPHMQTQSSIETRGFATSGFGISTQRPNPGLQTTMLGLDQEPMSPKQRENIDRWRQSVMP